MTLSWGMLARALMISSVMPSQKNSFSPLVLLFTKGRTAIEVLVCMDWSNGPKMRCFVELWCVVVLGSLGLGDSIRGAPWRWHLSLSRERILLSLAAKGFVGRKGLEMVLASRPRFLMRGTLKLHMPAKVFAFSHAKNETPTSIRPRLIRFVIHTQPNSRPIHYRH